VRFGIVEFGRKKKVLKYRKQEGDRHGSISLVDRRT